jgi:hypothetical protein
VAGADDLAGAYVDDVARVEQANATASLLARVKARRATAAPGATPGEPARLQTNPADVRAGYGRIAGDIITGATIDLPRAFANGVRDGVQEMLDLAKSAGDWLDKNVVDLTLPEKLQTSGELPDPGKLIGETETTTGGIIQQAVQFLTGFKAAGKVVKGAGVAASTAKSAISSFAAFDGHSGNLANLWQSAGLPQNVLTDYLASSPDDTEMEGRFKNALADAGLGVVVEGMTLAGNALRTARLARQSPVQAPDAAGASAALPQATAGDFDILGDVTQDKLIAKRELPPADFGVPDAVAAKGTAGSAADAKAGKPAGTGQPHEPEFFINWARIDEPKDVKNVMAQMADAFRPEVDAARRGKMTFAEIKLSAGQRSAWDDLAKRREGDPLGAEAATAARTLWASSSSKLAEVAELAAKNPSETNLFAFRKMVEVHRTIQNEVIAARTETARALAAWRIPVSSDALRHREISDLINGAGGPETARALALRIAEGAKMGKVAAVEQLVAKGAFAKTQDAVLEIWKAGLLWSPTTHVANIISNSATILQNVTERAVAARIGRLLGDADSVQMGEAMAAWGGIVDGAKDGMRHAAKMMMTGEDSFMLPGSKLDDARPSAFSAEAFAEGSTKSILYRAPGLDGNAQPNWLGHAVNGVGNTIRTSFRALAAEDQFFKSTIYSMELHAQAKRLATQEVNAGSIKPSMLNDRIEELLRNPPETVKLASADQALYQTFNNKPGEIAALFLRAKQIIPALNVIIPFVRTPANIFRYAAERSPVAPVFRSFRADLAAGGARRDLALARMGTGSMIMFTMADMALSGHITGGGPADPAQKAALYRSGWQPYSFKVGKDYLSYQRFDPLGLSIAMAADSVELMHNTDWNKRDTRSEEDVVWAITGAMANSTMSKSYMRGVSGMFDAVADRTGGGIKTFVERLAGSVVPSGAATIERVQDPYLREAEGVLQAMRARTPGISADLPLRRDLWGRPISFESGLGWAYDAFSPIYYRRSNPEPIDQEILKNGMNIQDPPHTQSFGGVDVDLDRFPGAFSRFMELAGNELKNPDTGQGAMDYLNAVVAGKAGEASGDYQRRTDGYDGGKELFVKTTLARYRAAARNQLLNEIPSLRAYVEDKRMEKAARRDPNARPTLQ